MANSPETAVATRTDQRLLSAYLRNGDAAAFAEIAERHGPMVYRVCYRILGDHHEAEDAAQATFAVLARKARSVRKRLSLGSWLHGAARMTALCALRGRIRRQKREEAAAMDTVAAMGAVPDDASREQALALLDEALAKLSPAQRDAVVLRHLQGRSIAEAAVMAECAAETLAGRTRDGLRNLRKFFAKRGLPVGAALLTSLFEAEAQAAVPQALLSSIKAVSQSVAAGAATGTAVSGSVASLTEGVVAMMNAMAWKQAIGMAACAVLVAGAGVAGSVAVRRDSAAREPAGMDAQAVSVAAKPAETPGKSFVQFRSRMRMPDGSDRFQLTMDGRTYFRRLGESAEGFELFAFEEKFEEQVVPGFSRPKKADVSVLTLRQGDKLVPLVLNRAVHMVKPPAQAEPVNSLRLQAIAEMEKIRHALSEFFVEYGSYPPAEFMAYEYENNSANHQSAEFRDTWLPPRSDPNDPKTFFPDKIRGAGKWPESPAFDRGLGYRYGLVSYLWPRRKGSGQAHWYDRDTARDEKAKSLWAPHLEGLLTVQTAVHTSTAAMGITTSWTNSVATVLDPWGREYHYESLSPHSSYRLWSAGPQGPDFPKDNLVFSSH